MTLDEAMASLSIQLEVKRRLSKNQEADAIGLGIEALKWCKKLEEGSLEPSMPFLPGETKDEITDKQGNKYRNIGAYIDQGT